jgi:hypothetical protein
MPTTSVAKTERRDDHLDHPQEAVGERLDRDAEYGQSSRRRCEQQAE